MTDRQKVGETGKDTLNSFDELKDLANSLGLPFVEKVEIDQIDLEILSKTPFWFARDNYTLPVRLENDTLFVVTALPTAMQPLDDLRLIYHCPVEIAVAPAEVLEPAINKAYDVASHSASDIIDDIADQREDLDALLHGLPEDLLETSAEAPVIRLVNSILMEAAKEKASDIHIEPYERELAVRFRVDGALANVVSPPKKLQPLIVSRVKVMAGLDIAEKRLPQDGRLKIVIAGKEIDIRISCIPTAFGERVVMRLLDKETMLLGFDQIGMRGEVKEQMEKLIHAPHGIILVSGPTGSGKTTTLYAALSDINSPDKNIITVEDPVEYQLPGVGQMQVNTKIGLSFATGLRSILRQDPDVIMVGEIRDQETASIAVQASLTGHLVFSTIHTNDAAGAITRLVDMGIEPFLIASSLLATVAQRLVRVLCQECKEEYAPDPATYSALEIDSASSGQKLYRPKGCSACKESGYRGRTGLYEILTVDDSIRALVTQNADSSMIRQRAIGNGFKPMRIQGAEAVFSGITSAEEILRVTSDVE